MRLYALMEGARDVGPVHHPRGLELDVLTLNVVGACGVVAVDLGAKVESAVGTEAKCVLCVCVL